MNPNEPETAAEAADPEQAEAAPKPRRRRTPKVAATAAVDVAPAAESVVVEDRSSAPAQAQPPEAAGHEAAGAAAGAAGEPGEGAADAGPTAPGEVKRRRGRRRRNRRGDRGEGETGVVAGDAAPARPQAVAPLPMIDVGERFADVVSGAYDADADAPALADAVAGGATEPGGIAATPILVPAANAAEDAPLPVDAGGESTRKTGAPGEATFGDEAAQTRRVLAPDADAPKLHKVLAQSGVGSRRDLEQMILEGRIAVNGEAAHTGQRVSFGDRVTIDGKPVKLRIAPPPARVLAYHKPAGEVVTFDDPQARPTVFRRLPRLAQGKWQSVGRLDINTEGLLLFTNSGDLANRLMHPRFGVEREYAVRVLGQLSDEARERLIEGVEIDGQAAAFKSIADGGGEGANHWYRVVISEGRNREVRKLFETVGLAVNRLIRIRYGSVVLPRGLKRGVWVDLSPSDVKTLRHATGMPQRTGGPGEPRDGRDADDRRGGRRGRRRGRGERAERGEPRPRGPNAVPYVADLPHEDAHEAELTGPIPNPLQQTYDKRAIQLARKQREFSEDGPIPNPLQQTYDKRALQGEKRQQREIDEDGPIPNPLQQTYDKRFVQGQRSGLGGGGGGGGGRRRQRNKAGGQGGRQGAAGGERQPDPMRTSQGYIGADAFHNKLRGAGGGRRGGGRKR